MNKFDSTSPPLCESAWKFNIFHGLVVEISFSFEMQAYDLCQITGAQNWIAGKSNPQKFMVKD